jgi:hypothetical protein
MLPILPSHHLSLHLPEKPGTESVNRKIPAGFSRFPFNTYFIKQPLFSL